MATYFRQLTISEDEHFVHDTPGTYPRLCRLSDNSLLVGFTAFTPEGGRVLKVARSTDEAKTFEPWGEVTRSLGECDNLFLLELPPYADYGRDPESESTRPTILAAFRNHDLAENGCAVYFRITVCRSTDGGRTWSFLSQGFEKPAPHGLWEPFLYVPPDSHEVHLYFSKEMFIDDQDTMLVRSTDGGATWSATERITGEGEYFRDGMVGLADAHTCDGEVEALVLVMETTRHRTFSIEAVVSLDGGETWRPRQVAYEPRKGRNAGAPQIAAFADGSVVVVFMTDEDGEGEPIWPQGAKIKVIYGTLRPDGELFWTLPEVVGDAASSWPGILRLADNIVIAVYESSSRIRGRILELLKK